MTRRIVFHVGLAKTGTTSFQLYCRDHRRQLLRAGLLYPARQCGWQHNHSPLVASYIAHRPEDRSVAIRWAPREQAVRALSAEIAASDARVALVSSEHFSTHFDRLEAAQLAADFAAFDPLVVITLRDPHARFLSSYNTHVTAGGVLPLEDYAHSMLVPGTRWMSGRETISIWQEAFGRERIRLIDYDAETDVTAAILRRCGIDALPTTTRSRDRISLRPPVIEALRCANVVIRERQTADLATNLGAWLQLSLFSILCRRRLQRELPRENPTSWTVSARTTQALDAIAADDRTWVAETYGLLLRGAAAPLERGRESPLPLAERGKGEGSRCTSRLTVKYGTTPTPDPSPQGEGEAPCDPASSDGMAAAAALVDRATRGLRRPSDLLVGLWAVFARGKVG